MIPFLLQRTTASRRARVSAVNVEGTNFWDEEKLDVWSDVITVHPRPEEFRHAASDCTITEIGFAGVGAVKFHPFTISLSWAPLHSRAKQIALETVSATEVYLLLKTKLFLSIHKDQSNQGARGTLTIPSGGKQTLSHRLFQTPGKSDDLLATKPDAKGVCSQTSWAKEQCKKRWLTDSKAPQRLHSGSISMRHARSLSPTGRISWRAFQMNNWILGVVFRFHTLCFQLTVGVTMLFSGSVLLCIAAQ